MQIVNVVPYSNVWREEFATEKAKISAALSEVNVSKIHHVGSTAVPGMCAVPIIDILVEVENLEVLDGASHLLSALGYFCEGEYGVEGRRYFHTRAPGIAHRIYAFASSSKKVDEYLAFRDYLIVFPCVAAEYCHLKKECANVCGGDMNVYSESKNTFISAHVQKAMARW
ncbi:GrpB family protein [Salinivibrio sp. YCSC6]|uniref:GrpB family protein n=1 Tax=Salinivibrio sp. YCSC6 TaxID=2003370 RepID=UPI000BBCE1BF|nr:GrpB family protein [Salinivibrio sp. YCSC6]PCE67548.1 hypothetical protein B6G00_04160 [Salinivibrio sp. YCSC6]QCF35545.1 GrpB family protein [Salinivibrio sp. YCSC6]